MPPQKTPARLALTAVALAYTFIGGAYLAYGYATDTGLSGWLSSWQMRTFGEADQRFTQLGTAAVWLLGLVPFFFLIRRLNQAEQFVPMAPAALPDMWSMRNRVRVAAAIAAVTLGIYCYQTYENNHLAAQPVRQLNLDQSDALPPDTELASIRGVLAANFGYLLEEKGSSTTKRFVYAPLLPASWQPGQPVRYVVKTMALAYLDSANNRAIMLDSGRAFRATYDGRLSANSLPTFVAQDYASQHLTLAAPYYVLDDQEVSMGRATLPGSSTRWLVLAIGLLVAGYTLVARKPQPRQ